MKDKPQSLEEKDAIFAERMADIIANFEKALQTAQQSALEDANRDEIELGVFLQSRSAVSAFNTLSAAYRHIHEGVARKLMGLFKQSLQIVTIDETRSRIDDKYQDFIEIYNGFEARSFHIELQVKESSDREDNSGQDLAP